MSVSPDQELMSIGQELLEADELTYAGIDESMAKLRAIHAQPSKSMQDVLSKMTREKRSWYEMFRGWFV